MTGAGDETLRFWNVFSKMRSTKVKNDPYFPKHHIMPTIVLTPPPQLCSLSGICVCAEPVHQDPIISTRLYDEAKKEIPLCMSGWLSTPFWHYPSTEPPPQMPLRIKSILLWRREASVEGTEDNRRSTVFHFPLRNDATAFPTDQCSLTMRDFFGWVLLPCG